MSQLGNRLTARAVQQMNKPGDLDDGDGLFLQLSRSGTKSWQFRFRLAGRARTLELGTLNDVPLDQARAKAAEARQQIKRGVDPTRSIGSTPIKAKAAHRPTAAPSAVPPQGAPERAGPGLHLVPSSGRPALLLAGTSDALVAMIKDTFGGDYDVQMTNDGAEALHLARLLLPDIALLAADLPGLDGISICRQLKADPRTRDIAVILIGAAEDPELEFQGLEQGAIDFCIQPVRPRAIALRLSNHLNFKRQTTWLTDLSLIDVETGLANRRQFEDALHKEWHRSRRLGTSLALLLIEPVGKAPDAPALTPDETWLSAFADRLRSVLYRPADLLARYGPTRFAVILPQTEQAGANLVARRLVERIDEAAIAVLLSGRPVALTARTGAAAAQASAEGNEVGLLRAADAQLTDKRMGLCTAT